MKKELNKIGSIYKVDKHTTVIWSSHLITVLTIIFRSFSVNTPVFEYPISTPLASMSDCNNSCRSWNLKTEIKTGLYHKYLKNQKYLKLQNHYISYSVYINVVLCDKVKILWDKNFQLKNRINFETHYQYKRFTIYKHVHIIVNCKLNYLLFLLPLLTLLCYTAACFLFWIYVVMVYQCLAEV